MTDLTVEEVIRNLGLEPHPDGGWWRQVKKDAHSVCGYHLVAAGQPMTGAALTQVEQWNVLTGAPLALTLIAPDGFRHTEVLSKPEQFAGPAGWERTAASLGEWTLSFRSLSGRPPRKRSAPRTGVRPTPARARPSRS